MGWITKIFKGSSHKIKRQGQYKDDTAGEKSSHSSDDGNEETDHARTISPASSSSSEEEEKGATSDDEDEDEDDQIDSTSQLDEDEQLAIDLQQSLTVESPPQYDYGNDYSTYPNYNSSGYSIYPRCDVCKNFIPTNAAGLIEYKTHPFWLQNFCPSHMHDGTPRCWSCERAQPVDGAKYLILDDGRKLCPECLDSAIMDTNECQPLYLEIQDFFEGLNMKVEQKIPMLLVDKQGFNEAMGGEKHGHHITPGTWGLCKTQVDIVKTIREPPKIGSYGITNMSTEPYTLTRRCEVKAILVLNGLPRLLTGSVLAHEMMHAYLLLKGYQNLRPDVEEGICQVLAHMWLDSEIMAGSGSNHERKFAEFCKVMIEVDPTKDYGDGFREGNSAVLKYGLRGTLDHILQTGCFP